MDNKLCNRSKVVLYIIYILIIISMLYTGNQIIKYAKASTEARMEQYDEMEEMLNE